MEASKCAKLCFDRTTNLFAIQISSRRPNNKLLTVETTMTCRYQNLSRKAPEESVEAI